MKNILHIDSSLFSQQGVSHQLAQELITTLEQQHNGVHLTHRDLGVEEIPHIDGEWIAARTTEASERSDSQQEKVDYSAGLIAEIQAADILIIGAPMYNFSVPSVLKAWFDHIAQAGVTFQYTAEGPQGLLKNKTAYVITTRGGIHKDTPTDTQVPFIKNFLSFIGIDDARFIYAEGLNMGDGAREQGIHEARKSIQQFAA